MLKKTSKIKNLLTKLAAKRFSKNEKIGLVMLFLCLGGFGYYALGQWVNTFKNEVNVIEPFALIKKPVLNASDKKTAALPSQGKVVTTPEIRDPFLSSKDLKTPGPSSMEKTPTTNLKLKGILWDGQIPSAIINSNVVKIGDLIFGKTVVDIERDKVILMEDGKVYILNLEKQ